MGRVILFCTMSAIILSMGCEEEMVGAPCVSETDNRKFSTELLSSVAKKDDVTWSIETGSVQCETHLCLTQSKKNPDADDIEDRSALCSEDPTEENCGAVIESNGNVVQEPVLLKFSFCSCRCEDGDGNRKADNPDKYDYLCECPPSAHCEPVLEKIGGSGDSSSAISEKLFGAYCVPECIADPCIDDSASHDHLGEVCTPSTNSEEPWLWSCEKVRH